MARHLPSVCLLAVIVASGATVSGQPAKTSPDLAAPAKVADEVFVAQALRNGRAEVELSKIALTKAIRPDVKVFAQRMVDDHTKFNAELVLLARDQDVILPQDPGQPDRAALDKLEKLTDEAFDRMYIEQMIADHQRAVETFTEQAQKGLDPVLKAWASKTVPALQHHLEMARELEKKLER